MTFPTYTRIVIFALILPTGGSGMVGQTPPVDGISPRAPATTRHQLGVSLIESAVAAAAQVEPESKALLLDFAADALAPTDRQKSREYYELAFDTSEKMILTDRTSSRVAVQAAIVIGVAQLDPHFAAELLNRVDRPGWTPYPERDQRAYAALGVVNALLHQGRDEDVDEALGVLQYLGETGQYPYEAAGATIAFLHDQGLGWRSSSVFAQALQYFRRDEQFLTSAEEFADLISRCADKVTPDLLVQGIRALVSSVRKHEESAAKEGNFSQPTILLTSGQRHLRFQRGSTYFAFRLLPLAARLDPHLVRDLRSEDEELRQLLEKEETQSLDSWSNASRTIVFGNPDAQRMHEIEQDYKSERIFYEAQEMAGKDLDRAVALAHGVERPDVRSRSLAGIARQIANENPQRAAVLLVQAEALLDKIQDARATAQSIGQTAEAWAQLKEVKRVSALVRRGFSVALDLYEGEKEKHREGSPLMSESAALLADLAHIEAAVDPREAAKRAESVADAALRAYLLLRVGQEILSQESVGHGG
jgi:hypothetical protein